MVMKTPEQLKGAIRNIAKNNELQAQEVLQLFLFERLLERLSLSPYKNNFILKGGLLISSIIGIAGRTTMDMDLTAEEISMEEENLKHIFKSIFAIDTGDGIVFTIDRLAPIHTSEDHKNYRIYLTASYGKIQSKMKIDTTSGDIITPAPIEYSFITLFDEKAIPIMAYTLETIIAEKYLTILRLGIANTRARDFYDLFRIFKLYNRRINKKNLKLAAEHTAAQRKISDLIKDGPKICAEIKKSQELMNIWQNYAKDFSYAADITFAEIISSVIKINKMLKS